MKKLFIATGIFFCFTSCKETNEQLLERGISYQQKQKDNEAIRLYSDIINNNSKLQVPYYNRGLCYIALNDYSKALTDFNTILASSQEDSSAIKQQTGTFLSDEEVKAQISYNDALYERAQILYKMDSVKNSYNDFNQLISANYQKSNCFLWVGILWIKGGDNNKACEMFHQAKFYALNQEEEKEAEVFINDNCN